jgi:hypothetical protein
MELITWQVLTVRHQWDNQCKVQGGNVNLRQFRAPDT